MIARCTDLNGTCLPVMIFVYLLSALLATALSADVFLSVHTRIGSSGRSADTPITGVQGAHAS